MFILGGALKVVPFPQQGPPDTPLVCGGHIHFVAGVQ
jgi:hypothetical protein